MDKLVDNCNKNIAIFGIVFLVICFSGCDKSTVIIEGPTEVLYTPCSKEEPGNRIIAILPSGYSTKIVDYGYEKDCKFYKIRLEDGQAGYIIGGHDFKVIEEKS